MGLIPGQGTYLGSVPSGAVCKRQTIYVSSSYQCLSLSLSLSLSPRFLSKSQQKYIYPWVRIKKIKSHIQIMPTQLTTRSDPTPHEWDCGQPTKPHVLVGKPGQVHKDQENREPHEVWK